MFGIAFDPVAAKIILAAVLFGIIIGMYILIRK